METIKRKVLKAQLMNVKSTEILHMDFRDSSVNTTDKFYIKAFKEHNLVGTEIILTQDSGSLEPSYRCIHAVNNLLKK